MNSSKETSTAAASPQARALILTDSASHRSSFARVVSQLPNCAPVTFEKIEDALSWAIPNQPELIILVDARPTHIGLDFLRRASAVAELEAIPKLFVTSNDPEARRRAVAFGANALVLPGAANEVTERLQSLLALSIARNRLTTEIQETKRQLRASESRSLRNLRRLETLYKASVEDQASDDDRFTAILNAGAHALRDDARFLGILARIHGDTNEILALADENFDASVVHSHMPKVGDRAPQLGSLEAVLAGKESVSAWNDLWADPATVTIGRVRELGLRSAIGTLFRVEREHFAVYFVSRSPAGETPFTAEDEAFIELLASIMMMFVKERKRTMQLRWQAERDDLTGLANRATFRKRLARAAGVGAGRHLAVLIFDLDKFQEINDTLGHPVGDSVLVAIGRRLQNAAKRGELVSRLGGDEFALSFAVEDAEAAQARAAELLALFEQPFSASGMLLQIGTTIGIALYPDHASSLEELLPRADAALYEAKRQERGSYRLFDPAIATRLEKRRALQNELREALASQQFVLYFQPEVDLATGSIVGAEALIRWRHPERGLVPPGEFIPYAEESPQLIRKMGAWIVERACDLIDQFTRDNPEFRLFVNLSTNQLSDPSLLSFLLDTISGRGLPSRNFGFEITESMAMADPKLTLDTVTALREQGFKIAIDDFGTGYSSLAYLTSLNPDVVKIDKSFVDNIPQSHGDAAIIETVVLFARKTERLVLAEGVEHLHQMAWLHETGVNIAQGYHIARPMPVNEFVLWQRRWKSLHHVGRAAPWQVPVTAS